MNNDKWLIQINITGYDGDEYAFTHSFLIPTHRKDEFNEIWCQWEEEEGGDADGLDTLFDLIRDAGIQVYHIAYIEEYEWGFI